MFSRFILSVESVTSREFGGRGGLTRFFGKAVFAVYRDCPQGPDFARDDRVWGVRLSESSDVLRAILLGRLRLVSRQSRG